METGCGEVVLSSNNSYTGGTYLAGGVLDLGNAAALPGNTALTVNGGAIINLSGRPKTTSTFRLNTV